jgi:SWI/SNF-related matrix-associated actin-dependent regulator 1 of chromatin subfamily A
VTGLAVAADGSSAAQRSSLNFSFAGAESASAVVPLAKQVAILRKAFKAIKVEKEVQEAAAQSWAAERELLRADISRLRLRADAAEAAAVAAAEAAASASAPALPQQPPASAEAEAAPKAASQQQQGQQVQQQAQHVQEQEREEGEVVD